MKSTVSDWRWNGPWRLNPYNQWVRQQVQDYTRIYCNKTVTGQTFRFIIRPLPVGSA